ncbi:fibrobacter succinogenes major paralogous domain-containing protein [Candidatus Gracilibacteria bacterium]|nr:fibrobacter succinogenes major paralogous domain-containing protein [Candidatus Gracilibacteria bacterium]
MPNQTSHTPTPGFQIKPPVITEELQRLVEENKKLIKTALPAMEANERRREEERLKNKKEFIEHNGIKLETENLGRPTYPKIQILQKGDKIIGGRPYCWNDGDDWYYNWYAAMLESKHLGKRLPTDLEMTQLFGSKNDIKLTKEDFEELMKKLNLNSAGHWGSGTFHNRCNYAFLWTSTEYNTTNVRSRDLNRLNAGVYRNCRDKSTNGFSVRCIFSEKKEETKDETELMLKRKEFLKRIKNKAIKKLRSNLYK